MRMRRPAEAIAIHRRSLDALRNASSSDDARVGLVTFNLAGAYRMNRDFERAEPTYREAIDILEGTGERESQASAIRARHELGAIVLPALGRVDEARALLLETVDRARRTLGPTHGMTANAIDALSHFCWRHGPLEEALDWSDVHLELIQGLYHPGDWRHLANAQRRTGLLLALGRHDQAIELGEDLLRELETSEEPDLRMRASWGMERAAWMGLWVRAAIAQAHLNEGRASEAELAAARLADACDRADLKSTDSFWPMEAERILGAAQMLGGADPAPYESRLREIRDHFLSTRGERDALAARAADTLGVCLIAQGRVDEGREQIRRAHAVLATYWGSRNLHHAPASVRLLDEPP